MYVSREQLVLTGVEDAGVDVVAAAEEEADEGGADEAAGAGDQHRLPRHLSRPFPELGWVSSHSECAATVRVPDCLSGYLTLGFFVDACLVLDDIGSPDSMYIFMLLYKEVDE